MAGNYSIDLSSENTLLPSYPPIYGRRFESDLLFVELCPKQPYQVQYQSNWHILGFALESQTGHHSFASSRIVPYHAPANTFVFIPANCETFAESSQGGSYLIFAVSPELFVTYVDDLAAHKTVTLHRLSPIRNRYVTAIGRATRQFIRTNPSGGRLYFESLAGQFVTHVILTLLSKSEVKTKCTKLGKHTLAQLIEFIEANLSEDLSLNALAEVTEMSPSQFRRAFKATVGQSPHSWLNQRRLDHAKNLLAKTKQPIAQIALDCGFSSQSHMTMLFSKHLGTTPRKYKRSI
jgi:AraC family transcriptional regulator